jgi:hypothetical protein
MTESDCVQPDDIGKILVAISKVLSENKRFVDAIRSQRAQPTDCFDWVQNDDHSICIGEVDYAVRTLEIGRIWRRKIISSGEWRDPVKRSSIRVASGAIITQEIDPQRIDAVASAILHEKRGLHWRQVADQGLRGRRPSKTEHHFDRRGSDCWHSL